MSDRNPIVVVGAGAAGLMAAGELAKAGKTFRAPSHTSNSHVQYACPCARTYSVHLWGNIGPEMKSGEMGSPDGYRTLTFFRQSGRRCERWRKRWRGGGGGAPGDGINSVGSAWCCYTRRRNSEMPIDKETADKQWHLCLRWVSKGTRPYPRAGIPKGFDSSGNLRQSVFSRFLGKWRNPACITGKLPGQPRPKFGNHSCAPNATRTQAN